MTTKKYKLYDLSHGFKFVGRYADMKDVKKGAKSYLEKYPNCRLEIYKYRADLDAFELMIGESKND